MKQTLSEYERKVLKETPGDYNADWIMVQCGQCQFCGHPSKMGYWVTQKVTGKRLLVGTDCVYTLTNLDRAQKKVFDGIVARQKHARKYAKVLAYLLETHKNELVTTLESFHRFHKTRYDVTGQDAEWVYYNWVSNETNEICLKTKMRVADWEQRNNTYVANYDWNAPKTAHNIAAIIINKIETTRSTINKYWLTTYKELTGVDLAPLMKVE
jgi:hypothetical protein